MARGKEEQEKPSQPAVIFRRHDDPRWWLAGYGKAEYYKDGRRMRFSHWSTYDLTRHCDISSWVSEHKIVTKEEAERLCQA